MPEPSKMHLELSWYFLGYLPLQLSREAAVSSLILKQEEMSQAVQHLDYFPEPLHRKSRVPSSLFIFLLSLFFSTWKLLGKAAGIIVVFWVSWLAGCIYLCAAEDGEDHRSEKSEVTSCETRADESVPPQKPTSRAKLEARADSVQVSLRCPAHPWEASSSRCPNLSAF